MATDFVNYRVGTTYDLAGEAVNPEAESTNDPSSLTLQAELIIR